MRGLLPRRETRRSELRRISGGINPKAGDDKQLLVNKGVGA
jgi:hypothetical protein